MSKIIASVFAALAVALAAPVAFADPGSDAARKGAKETRVEGTITAVNVQTGAVTIAARGKSVVVTAGPGTKIERNDRHVTLAAFKVGDRGEARIAPNGFVTKIEATGK